MNIDRSKAKEAFDSYTSNYDLSDSKIRLKYEHTYRVAQFCDMIARSIGMNEDEINLAWSCGLLHDIGRFEQVRRYNTFVDKLSVDHGHLSIEILYDENKLYDFVDRISDRESQILKDAIWNHSNYRLPEGLDEETIMFCNILRDADKIDILKVNVDFPLEDIYNTTTDVIMNSSVSEEVMESLKEHKTIPHAIKKSPIDYIVGHVSLAYELVYPYSLQLLLEQGYWDKLLNFSNNNPKTNEQFEMIREEINRSLLNK